MTNGTEPGAAASGGVTAAPPTPLPKGAYTASCVPPDNQVALTVLAAGGGQQPKKNPKGTPIMTVRPVPR